MTKIIKKIKESGSALLLTLLIVTAILGTAMSFASFIVSGIRRAQLITQAQAAYYKAEGGTEQALYEIRKNRLQNIKDLEGVIECQGECQKRTVNYDSEILFPYIPQDQVVQFDLIDPNGGVGAGVQCFKVTCSNYLVSGSLWLEIGYTKISDGTNWLVPVNSDSFYKELKPCNASVVEHSIAISGTNPDQSSYTVRIRPLYYNARNVDIKAYPTNDCTGNPKTMASKVIINTEASYLLTSQKITVEVPRRSPLSAIFDYVIFSESAVQKTTVGAPSTNTNTNS